MPKPTALSINRAGVLALGIIFAVFGTFEILERTALKGSDPEVLQWFHIVRGLGASLLVAALLLSALARNLGVPLNRPLPFHFTSSSPAAPELLAENLWFIRLRWLASVFVVAAVATALASGLLPETPPAPLLAAALALPAANVGYLAWCRRSSNLRAVLGIQIAVDLILLSVLLHYSGGIQNPLLFLSAFHVIIAGILLSRREAYAVAGLAILLLLSLGVREMAGLLPRYPIAGVPHLGGHSVYALGVALALGFELLGAAFFTTAIMDMLRRRERELIQAGKMGAIGELSGALAHEINNPLGIILGKVEGLLGRNGLVPEPARNDLRKIEGHIHRISRITRGLLSASRPSYGRKEPVDLGACIEEALEMLRPRARGCQVNIESDVPGDLAPVFGNPGELIQILLNLGNNAIDAMPRGGALVFRAWNGGSERHLEVSDTGCGMPPDVRKRLFEPFFTTRPEAGGTGLGLAICQGLVRSHGGRIEVRSAPGLGSSFHVVFPALQEEPAR